MNLNNTLQTDVLDILFAGKNKSYGAYELRKTYNKRLLTALFTMIIACFVFTFIFSWKSKQQTFARTEMVGPVIDLKTISTHPKEEFIQPLHQPKPIQVQHVQVATIKVTTPKITDDKWVTEPPATQDAIENLKIDIKPIQETEVML